MKKRIFNQSNKIYHSATRVEFEESSPNGTRSYTRSQYNQKLPDVERRIRTNLNRQVSDYSSGYQEHVNRRPANGSQSRMMSLDRSKTVEYPVDIYPKSTNYARQVESKLEHDNRTRLLHNDLGENSWTNIQRSSDSNLQHDYQRGSLIMGRNKQVNYRTSFPEQQAEYRRSSDNFRTSKNGRFPERNETADRHGAMWRCSQERYSSDDDCFHSFSSAENITSPLDHNKIEMQPETERFVSRYLSSDITEAERRFQPPDTSNFKGFWSANQSQERNSKNRPYLADKRTSGTVQSFSNKNQRPFSASKKWIGKPGPNITGIKPRQNITGSKPISNISGLKPRQNITGVKPNPNNTGVKPRPNSAGVKPGRDLTGVKTNTKRVTSVKQGSIPTELQNRKRKLNVTSQVMNESWKKPRFKSPGSKTREAAEVTGVRTNPPPVATGTLEASVQLSGTTTAKKKKRIVLDAESESIEPEDLSLVVLRNFPFLKMTSDQTELTRNALMKEIQNVEDESMRLRFASCNRRRGTLVLFSKDDEVHEWLNEVVKTIEPWDGAEFRVIRQGSLDFTWTTIVFTDFPDKSMTSAQLSVLHEALVNKMEEEPDETSPHFVDCCHWSGLLTVAYTRQEDFEWLKNTVQDLQLFEEGQLQLVDNNDMPVFNKIEMWVPSPFEDREKVLERLDRQNTGLNTKNWYMMRYIQRANCIGHSLVLSVEDSVIEALKKIDFQPFLNFTRITVVNKGKLRNVPFTNSVLEQDLREATLLDHLNVGGKG